MLISAEHLLALEERLSWASQERADENGEPVGLDVVAADLRQRPKGLSQAPRWTSIGQAGEALQAPLDGRHSARRGNYRIL